jgi:ligand-binding sensor domain-containing protein/signal transduction histidine kinase
MHALGKVALDCAARRATPILALRVGQPFRAMVICLNAFAAAVPLALLSESVDAREQISTRAKQAVPQVPLDSQTMRLPVTDGNDIRFRRIFTATGLWQTRVSHIVQDNEGFLWFGTQYGLNRYDGYEFKVFKHDPGHTQSLSGVYIYALFKDHSGALWIGTDQSLDRFDPMTETFTHFPVGNHDPNGLPILVVHICQDHDGLLWLSTYNGLYNLNPTTGALVHFLHDPKDPSSLSSNDIKAAGEGTDGRLWVANAAGLDELDRSTGKVLLHVALKVVAREFSFYEDHAGVFWILDGSDDGVAVLDRRTNRVIRYSLFDPRSGRAVRVGVYSMLEDRDGVLWLATSGAGLLKFDRERRRFIRYRNYPGNTDSLGDDHLTTLFEDREGNIWVGLHQTAPDFFSKRSPPFEIFRHQPGNSASLGGRLVTTIYEDGQGILWIGSTGAFDRIDRRSGNYLSSRTIRRGINADVLSIIKDRADVLWVGTAGQGVGRFETKSERFRVYQHDPNNPSSLSNDVVNKLLIDHSGTLWATTWDGLDRFDRENDGFTVYRPEGRSVVYGSIMEDSQGILWLSGPSGLHRFDPATGKFTIFKHSPDDASSLSSNRVVSTHIDRSGTMWVATKNGLGQFDAGTGQFKTYYERDGLGGNAIDCILEDERGGLWLSTNKGISRFDPTNRTFTNYSAADGLPGEDLTGWNACFKSPGGEMFFGGFSGAVAFHPDKVVRRSYVPPTVLTDLRLSGTPVEIGSNSPVKKSITYLRDLTLTHEQNVFSLTFSALSYSSPGTNRYRYKLQGLDRRWNEVGSDRRLATYTTLPAGKYTFLVQGATSSGAWGEPGVALRIEILPPWWGTSWFRVIIAVLLVCSVLALYYYRVRQLEQQFRIRLGERLGERTRIARELHDSLLQGFQGLMFRLQAVHNMLPARPAEAMDALEAALDKGDQAIAAGREAVQGLRSSALVGNDVVRTLTALDEELASTECRGEVPTYRVRVEGKPRSLDPKVQYEVYRIAREALRNAFRHSSARAVEAEISYGDRLVSLRIRDDGTGFDLDVLGGEPRLGHWGIHGMRERAISFGGQLSVWSKQGAGTEVELTIPASVAYGRPAKRVRFPFTQNAG